jgi:hypothetical protein
MMVNDEDILVTNPEPIPEYDPALISAIRSIISRHFMYDLSCVQPIEGDVMESLFRCLKESGHKG